MKGYLKQDGIPTPDKPVPIETQVIGENLFETYEVNGRKYTDNLPKNALISIPKKQYIEYEQQKEEIKRLNTILNDFNHRFAKIEGICNEMIIDRMYMNEYAIKRYAEEIKEIVFYYIIELKGDSSNE